MNRDDHRWSQKSSRRKKKRKNDLEMNRIFDDLKNDFNE